MPPPADGDEEECEQCGHSFANHAMKTIADPPLWGWIICPEEDCDCWATWAVANMYTPEHIREMLTEWAVETGLTAD
jgi:hypothetical protein